MRQHSMCELLSMFIVAGVYELSPVATGVQILNDGVVEEFVVPTEQYLKCKSEDYDVQSMQKAI